MHCGLAIWDKQGSSHAVSPYSFYSSNITIWTHSKIIWISELQWESITVCTSRVYKLVKPIEFLKNEILETMFQWGSVYRVCIYPEFSRHVFSQNALYSELSNSLIDHESESHFFKFLYPFFLQFNVYCAHEWSIHKSCCTLRFCLIRLTRDSSLRAYCSPVRGNKGIVDDPELKFQSKVKRKLNFETWKTNCQSA